jgi:hypothetical protein
MIDCDSGKNSATTPAFRVGVRVGLRFKFGEPPPDPTRGGLAGYEPCFPAVAPSSTWEARPELLDRHPVEREGHSLSPLLHRRPIETKPPERLGPKRLLATKALLATVDGF